MKSNNKDGNSAKITRASVEKTAVWYRVKCDFSCHCLAGVTSVDEWIIDSGACQHMTNNRKYFKKIDKVREVGNGRSLSVEGVGSIQLKLQLSSGKTTNCVVKNVLFVPKLASNLLGVGKLAERGRVVRFMENNCKILNKQNTLVAVGLKRGKLYFLNCSSCCKTDRSLLCTSNNSALWHKRYCHLGYDNLLKLILKIL